MKYADIKSAVDNFERMRIASSYASGRLSFENCSREHVIHRYIASLPDFAFDDLRAFLVSKHDEWSRATRFELKSLGVEVPHDI